MKYSKGFERDYTFYLQNIDNFVFCGTVEPSFVAIPDSNGKSAKECFMRIDSNGVNLPCNEPELLNRLLLCKASINFQIKQWAEGRSDGTLPLMEFSKRAAVIKNKPSRSEYIQSYLPHRTLEWKNGVSIYHRDIEKQYGLPQWVIEATEKQSARLNRDK